MCLSFSKFCLGSFPLCEQHVLFFQINYLVYCIFLFSLPQKVTIWGEKKKSSKSNKSEVKN